MKKALFIVFLLAATTCFPQVEKIAGNGNLAVEKREISSYNGIIVSGNVQVNIHYGEESTILVSADSNILPLIETTVENGCLQIKLKDKILVKSSNKLSVEVWLTKISRLRVSGSGSITGDGDFTNEGRTDLAVSGAGQINLGINHFNRTKLNISGSGSITLKGKNTNHISAAISGSGKIDCSQVSCDDVLAQVNGSGNIRVNASNSIDAKVSGRGNIYYTGEATSVSIKSVGTGKIIKS